MGTLFQKVLVANRGEIAVRVVRACRELGIKTVVVHSEADKDTLPVHLADQTVCIGPAASSKSYLNYANIIAAALMTNADAIHPGYGFLSENFYFADICRKYNITFIGPSPEVISLMSSKADGRQTMASAGVRILPGSLRPLRNLEEALDVASEIGYPVILKATAGGGGRGMRIVTEPGAMPDAYSTAQLEAQNAFSNGQLIMEKYLARCRHIEVQVLGDQRGVVVGLGERDCTVQRRHQKLIEEAPSPALTPDQRQDLIASAVRGAQAVGYTNAGTLEFLMDADTGQIYFIEMNTRVQVEHGVTEMLTGIDIVAEQIKIASGYPLSFTQDDIQPRGHAIECRITAEDMDQGFRPQFGTVTAYIPPGGPGVRVDSHLFAGYAVPVVYDSLLAKLIAWAPTREQAIARARRAIQEYTIAGITTTLPFHAEMLAYTPFVAGQFSSDIMDGWQAQHQRSPESPAAPPPQAPVLGGVA